MTLFANELKMSLLLNMGCSRQDKSGQTMPKENSASLVSTTGSQANALKNRTWRPGRSFFVLS